MKKDRTHCKYNHPLSGTNVYIVKNVYKACRKCRSNYMKIYINSNKEKIKNNTNRYINSRKWILNNQYKVRCHEKVMWALKTGKLKRNPCFCGEIKVDAHHDDYTKPLEVLWLCRKHHKLKHTELRNNYV